MAVEGRAATCATAERVGNEGTFEELWSLLLALRDQLDVEVSATVLEATATWTFRSETVPDEEAAKVVALLSRWAEECAMTDQLAEQARDVADYWQDLRVREQDMRSFATWPRELRMRALLTLGPTEELLTQISDYLPEESDPGVVRAILGGLGQIKKPRKGSRLRTRLERALNEIDDPSAAKLRTQWNNRAKWRGIPKPDPNLPLEGRLEQWVWEADERYGIPDAQQITRREVGMFLKMAEDLCELSTAEEWEQAAEYLEAENFHGLVEGCARRAQRLRK